MNWAVMVIWVNGEQEYLKQGMARTGEVARFTKAQAIKQREFMRIGMEGDEDVQAIVVVKAPKGAR